MNRSHPFTLRQNKPNLPIEDRSLSPLVAGTPPIKPVSASLKVTKNAKKTLVLRCFRDISTRFGLFLPLLRAFRTPICAFLHIFFSRAPRKCPKTNLQNPPIRLPSLLASRLVGAVLLFRAFSFSCFEFVSDFPANASKNRRYIEP